MRLSQILFSQGFGSRRVCLGLIQRGDVAVAGQTVDDPDAEFDTGSVEADFVFSVRGRPWPYRAQAVVLMHKPAGYECSQKPRHHPSVMSLLPAPLRERGLQPIGRLDEDTTGLLLFTDDGQLIHRLTSPRHHVPKVYEVGAKHAVDEAQLQRLRDGVVLDDDPAPVRAAAAEATGPHALRLTLTEGKYHQVKRMLAAVGNRCESLHRSAFGSLVLGAETPPGQWRWLTLAEQRALSG